MTAITPVRVATHAMRTRFEIVLWDPQRGSADLRAAGEEALGEVAEAEALLSAHRPGADMHRLNARLRDASGTVDVPPRLALFLHNALHISRRADGAFDPTLGNADAVSFVAIDTNMDAQTECLITSRPGIRFDAGAIGKGYALDRARDMLQELGVRNALLHGGTSSVLALGSDPAGNEWRIAIASPEPGLPVAVWGLRDGDAMGVSANYERAAHIIDPRTGQPVTQSRLVAVLMPGSAAVADAVSTALLVAGGIGAPSLRSGFPEVREWLVVQKESDGGNSKMEW